MSDRTAASAATTTTRRLGRYELIAEIARGGMGAVLLARVAGAGGFQRLFAIKLLHRQYLSDDEFVEMLLDEARIAARLHHPNVVGITEVIESNEFGYGLVMDYVEGFTAWDANQALGPLGPQRWRFANRVLIDALHGLDAAHTLTDDDGHPLRVVHRDVSPQNILIGVDGVARVTDFGIAKAAARMSSTRAGQVKGKVAYMAPEQARGKPLDARTDVFAVGICLWELLTAQRLFKRQSEAETFAALMTGPVPHLREVAYEISPALGDVCARALQRDPDQRFPSASAMAEALERAARESNLLADRREVGDWIRTTFAAALEGRRKAIRAATGADAPRPTSRGTTGSNPTPSFERNAAPISQPLTSPPTQSISTSAVRSIEDAADEWDEAPDTTVGSSPRDANANDLLESLATGRDSLASAPADVRQAAAEYATAARAAAGRTPPARQSPPNGYPAIAAPAQIQGQGPAAGRDRARMPASTMVGVDLPAGVSAIAAMAQQGGSGPIGVPNRPVPAGVNQTKPGGYMSPAAELSAPSAVAAAQPRKLGVSTAIGVGPMGPIPGTVSAADVAQRPVASVPSAAATTPMAPLTADHPALQQFGPVPTAGGAHPMGAAPMASARAATTAMPARPAPSRARTWIILGVFALLLAAGSVAAFVIAQRTQVDAAQAAARASASASASAALASAQRLMQSAAPRMTAAMPTAVVVVPSMPPPVAATALATAVPTVFVPSALPTVVMPSAVPTMVMPTVMPVFTAAPMPSARPTPIATAPSVVRPTVRPTPSPRPRPSSQSGVRNDVPF